MRTEQPTDLGRPDGPTATAEHDGSDAEDPLGAVTDAMRQLQGLIDEYLESPSPSRSSRQAQKAPRAQGAPQAGPTTTPVTPVADVVHDPAPSQDDPGGWGRALAVREPRDRQVSWIEANAALRRGEHARAFELFEAEAEAAVESGDHSRAAIAFRMASDAAAALGRRDRSDHDLRRAGKQYLFVAEDPTSSLQAMYSAYLAASRCFLAVGNLELTQSCVGRALDLQEAINEDLHSRFNSAAPQSR